MICACLTEKRYLLWMTLKINVTLSQQIPLKTRSKRLAYERNKFSVRQFGAFAPMCLGDIETEQFIALIQREPFDYTKWLQGLDEDISTQECLKHTKAMCVAAIRKEIPLPSYIGNGI